MKKELIFIATLISIIFFINSCSKGSGGSNPAPADPCLGLSFKFAADVQPIVNTTCAISSNCHAAGSTNRGGPLTDYNKNFVKRSDIKFQIEAGLMPQSGSISADQKNKLICWINSGAPNN